MDAFQLNELRNKIDSLDHQIIELLAQRYELTEQVGIYKATYELNAQDEKREAAQFKKIAQLAEKNGLNPQYATEIYRCVMDLAIARHQEIKQAKK